MRLCRFFLLTLLLPAIYGDLQAQQLPLKSYTTVDGLAHNHINRIVRDSHGFLWFCTAGGLSRFDGYTFANFGTEHGLPHSSVNDLLETRSGEYWVATDGGLVRFDPKGSAYPHTVVDSAVGAPTRMLTAVVNSDQGTRAKAVNVLLERRDGSIWAGTDAGLYRLERANGRLTLRPIDVQLPSQFPDQRIISDLLEDAHGSLWLATPSGLYRQWPDGTSARYTTRDGLPTDYLGDLFEDHAGRLWAGTRLAGFFRFTANATRAPPRVDLGFSYHYQYKYGLPTSWVFQLLQTSDQRFWVSTANGLVEFFADAKEHDRFRTYSTTNGLADQQITSVGEDLGGNLWLGTYAAGAMKLARGGFITFREHDGIKSIHAVFEDQAGNLCFRGQPSGEARAKVLPEVTSSPISAQFASYQGFLGCFNRQGFEWFKPAAVTDLGWVGEHVDLRTRNGDWWIGTGEGVYRFPSSARFSDLKTARPMAVYSIKDGLVGQVYRLFEDSGGDVWISSSSAAVKGLARWDHTSEQVRDLTNSPGLPSLGEDLAISFGEDRTGNVWIGFKRGVARYVRNRFTFFAADHGLSPGAIVDIHLDRAGRLWLGSDGGGLIRVDNADAVRPTFVSYTTAHGLSSNNTEVIVEDGAGRLYVGGGRGLDRFDPVTGRVKHFTTADGLAPGLFRAAFRDRNGLLWFGMMGGLSRLEPVIDQPTAPPPVFITGLRVAGIPRPVSAVGERELSLPDFAPGQNQLEIDFVGLGFAPGDVLRYQYKLNGADAEWSAVGEQRTVTYASLAPGSYTFVVRALNTDAVVSDRPASIAFTVLSPFWRRWWVLTLAASILSLIAYLSYRRRIARLLAMANMRTRIATDLHDDIGANLTRIALLSEVAKKTQGVNLADEGAPLASITRIARESVSTMSDIVWAINPRRESLLDLIRRMRQHADEVFTLRDIQLRFTAPPAADHLRLSLDVRRDVLLIFKEAVNNAARHSRCSHVDIELAVEASRFVLTIVDDGAGFDTSVESEGQGRSSMQRRARSLRGTLHITSACQSGTTVKLDIPI